MNKKKRNKPSTNDRKLKNLLSEIGSFVVEFEKLQKEVKELIINCFEKEELRDTNLIQIVLYQATSYELTEYFRGLMLYQVSKMEKHGSKVDTGKLEILKRYIKIANENLQEAATFRNDLLHASYDNTTVIDWKKNNSFKVLTKFQGQRSKIKSMGIELNHINIEPKVFEKVIEMMMVLRFLINHIDSLINKDFFKTFNFNDDALKLYRDINIKAERAKLFEVNEGYYLKTFIFKRDMKARKEYDLAVQRGEISGGG